MTTGLGTVTKQEWRPADFASWLQAGALAVAFVYYSGYYINTTFCRNYGVSESELIRLEYIKIGAIYVLMTIAAVVLPVLVFKVSLSVRRSSALFHPVCGIVGNSLNAIVWLGFLIFLPGFATSFDFYKPLSTSYFGMTSFKSLAVTGLVVGAFATIAVPGLERLLFKKKPHVGKTSAWWISIELLRFGLLLVSLLLVGRALGEIAWLPQLMSKGIYFLMTCWTFALGITFAGLWVNKIKGIKGSGYVYPIIVAGILVFWYLSVSSYVHGVYKFVPVNRGGKLPVTESFLRLKRSELALAELTVAGAVNTYGPVYILEESGSRTFLVGKEMSSWTTDFVPVHVLNEDDIEYVFIHRIEDGYPRYSR